MQTRNSLAERTSENVISWKVETYLKDKIAIDIQGQIFKSRGKAASDYRGAGSHTTFNLPKSNALTSQNNLIHALYWTDDPNWWHHSVQPLQIQRNRSYLKLYWKALNWNEYSSEFKQIGKDELSRLEKQSKWIYDWA